jgi:Na+/melibiose symporter-like transporter
LADKDIVSEGHAGSEIVPLGEKLAFSLATMPGVFYSAILGVIQSFYYGWMGLQNYWIVIAQIIYAVWNVVNDPIFGNRINNTKYYNKKKKEYQRYIPYIKFGAPIFSLFFALVFFPPDSLRGQPNDLTIQVWLFVWYLVSQIAYDTMFTIVLCAHVALLPQMTLNQREREKIQLFSTIFSLPAIIFGFILPVMFLTNPTAVKIAQFQILVIIIAIIGMVPYFIIAKVVHEHSEHIPEQQKGTIESLKIAWKNKSFRIYVIYDGVSVFVINVLMSTVTFYLTWVLTPLGADLLLFFIGPIICLLISIPLILKIAKKYSTKASISYSLAVLTIGFFFTFFIGFLGNWVLISVGISIIFFGFAGDFIQHNPMRADTIDYDYWKVSGERREGLYAGIGPLLSKPMISVALAVPTTIMTAFGLIFPYEGATGLVATQGMGAAFLSVNISFALLPGIASLIGFIIWVKYYPLTGRVVEEMKRELAKIQEQKRKDYEKSKTS